MHEDCAILIDDARLGEMEVPKLEATRTFKVSLGEKGRFAAVEKDANEATANKIANMAVYTRGPSLLQAASTRL